MFCRDKAHGELTGVQADMISECGRLAEAALAELAGERFLEGVDAHV